MKMYFKISVGEEIDRDDLIKKLLEYNYTRVDEIVEIGDFSVRGNILECFPFNFRSPVRIEFDFDKIESIQGFLMRKGDSISSYDELTLLPIHDFYQHKNRSKNLSDFDPMQTFFKINKGDYVVHVNYGIGRYLGVKHLKAKGVDKKYYAIEYAEKEILYVELDGPKLIEKYVGMETRKPKLNRLNAKDWQKVKNKTRLAVKSVAKDLLTLQAKRDALEGIQFSPDSEWQKEFESEFPYQETPDQIKATIELKKDMQAIKPMDRLLCGDVGYGKTEVAMRAAFKAIMDNRQVAMLVPTTILAEQHYITFKERVKSFPIKVEALSRFKTGSEQKEIIEHLKDGSCDIVIGTHRLLSKDVEFKNLGLVIIDEEQRFGVRHKEKLKHYRELVDVLTLTATPIPRTLYMSLMGARDISMITTPPKSRLPVHTEVLEYSDRIVKEAITRELKRGGQVYFVHNRVKSIDRIFTKLVKLLPKVKIGVAHGQMQPKALEKLMLEFFNGNLDCLLATSIIESGLDVPNVNTIIINRADMFGLSDLYQLRGRVGRFSKKRRAYAYMMIPKGFALTQDAMKRLRAIEKYTELGSGFKIAMEDLELRGAGNLLGSEQSGFIHQVGFDLYCKLLHEAIEDAKKAKETIV